MFVGYTYLSCSVSTLSWRCNRYIRYICIIYNKISYRYYLDIRYDKILCVISWKFSRFSALQPFVPQMDSCPTLASSLHNFVFLSLSLSLSLSLPLSFCLCLCLCLHVCLLFHKWASPLPTPLIHNLLYSSLSFVPKINDCPTPKHKKIRRLSAI